MFSIPGIVVLLTFILLLAEAEIFYTDKNEKK